MSLSRRVTIVGAGMTRFHHKMHENKQRREIFSEAAIKATYIEAICLDDGEEKLLAFKVV